MAQMTLTFCQLLSATLKRDKQITRGASLEVALRSRELELGQSCFLWLWAGRSSTNTLSRIFLV
eukprot:scaffold1192_cov80-Skeletonema_marinoi.AAC.9